MANKVTIYRSTDLGGDWPTQLINDNITVEGQRSYKAIYSILKMCLVDGYEGKPGAGWSMEFDEIEDGTGWRYALVNASKTGALHLEPNPNYGALATVCDTVITPDVLVNDWCGNYSKSNNQSGGRLLVFKTEYAEGDWSDVDNIFRKEFIVIATENSAIIHIHSSGSGLKLKFDDRSYSNLFYIGAAFYSDNLNDESGPLLGNFVAVTDTPAASRNAGYYNYGPLSLFPGSEAAASLLRDHYGSPFTVYPGNKAHAFFPYLNSQLPASLNRVLAGNSQLIPAILGLGESPNDYNNVCSFPFYVDIFHASAIRLNELQKHLNTGIEDEFGFIINYNSKQYVTINGAGKSDSACAIFIPMNPLEWP